MRQVFVLIVMLFGGIKEEVSSLWATREFHAQMKPRSLSSSFCHNLRSIERNPFLFGDTIPSQFVMSLGSWCDSYSSWQILVGARCLSSDVSSSRYASLCLFARRLAWIQRCFRSCCHCWRSRSSCLIRLTALLSFARDPC